MTLAIEFVLHAKPVPKGRPRFSTRGGYAKVYTPPETVQYELLVSEQARQAMQGREPHSTAIKVHLVVGLVPPTAWSKKRKVDAINGVVKPTSKPDTDNYLKTVMDAMNGIVYIDDSQVTMHTARKLYAEEYYIAVRVSEDIE